MKKLLALVLCVMMFVSVMSTSAFAAKPTVPAHPDLDTGYLIPSANKISVAANEKAIKNAKENIEYMYGALAADNAVFGAIKSVDSVVSSLAKEMFKDVDSIWGITGGTLESNTKTVLRDYIGSQIIHYMDNHSSDFETASTSYKANGLGLTYTGKQTLNGGYIYVDNAGNIWGYNGIWWSAPAGTSISDAMDDNGGDVVNWTATNAVVGTTTWKYNPIAYANTFAKAVNEAMASKEGASTLQNLAYQLYALKVYDELDDKFDDLYDDILVWEDGKAILSQYHFHDTLPNGNLDWGDVFSAYAFMDLDDYPNWNIPGNIADEILAP